MGSSPSSPKPSQSSIRSSAPSTSRSTGFREVQLQAPPGASGAGRQSATSTPRPTPSPYPKQETTTPSPYPKQETTKVLKNQSNMSRQRQPDPGEFSDLSSVAGALHRERTMINPNEQPQYKDDEMVMETFYHQNGQTYSCLFQGGQRFYLDSFQGQDWIPFPKEWLKFGLLVTDNIIKDPNSQRGGPATSTPQGGQSSQPQGRAAQYAPQDDRSGVIDHPKKGRLQTYVFEETKNVHYYFDKDTGSWVRLPIAWEFHTDIVKRLIDPVQDALPNWTDKHDMLATLRACNYDPQECITTFLAVNDEDGLVTPKNAADAQLLQDREDKIKNLTKEVDKLKLQAAKSKKQAEIETAERKSAEKQVQELEEKLTSLKVSASSANAQLEAMRVERPKTARPPSARPKTPAAPREPEHEVEPETVLALKSGIANVHKDQLKLGMEAKKRFEEMSKLFQQLSVGVMKIKLCDSGQSSELQDLRELYRKEALQRKLLYNKLQELRGNIRVFARCRYDNRTKCCLQFPTDHEILPPGAKKCLKFDKVFTPKSTQEEVYDEASPIITSCVDGYNVSILAYGQTGSGKTFTMQGSSDNPGVNVRALQELLKICDERENIDYNLKASMIEIYNENIRDLLRTDVKSLELRAQGNKVVLPGVTEMDVENLDDIAKIMKCGDKNRTTAETKMNSQSSRSHLIFMITILGKNVTSGAVTTGTLTLCDLAGSERVGKTEATGQRLVEAAAINKSLSALGQVFNALKTQQLHVPYRNSKLTHILQPSLSGDAKACLFVAVSPDQNNVQESISTLQFGSSARQVALGQAKQNMKKAPPGGFGGEDF